MAALNTEFAASGKLSDESLAALEKAGIGKPMVDAYIAGQQAIAQQYDAKLYAEAGSQETYNSMVDWAAANFSKEEKTEFNNAVNSMDAAKGALAIAALKSRFTAANGSDPTLLGGAQSSGSVQPYVSQAEMTKDMKTTEYKTDPAFRAKVHARLAITNNIML
jgi:hypothetical protein